MLACSRRWRDRTGPAAHKRRSRGRRTATGVLSARVSAPRRSRARPARKYPLGRVGDAAVAIGHDAQGIGRALVREHARAGLDPGVRALAGGAVGLSASLAASACAAAKTAARTRINAAEHGPPPRSRGDAAQPSRRKMAAPSHPAVSPFRRHRHLQPLAQAAGQILDELPGDAARAGAARHRPFERARARARSSLILSLWWAA